jgi:NDP-sugar pyrophosphorylase family protein
MDGPGRDQKTRRRGLRGGGNCGIDVVILAGGRGTRLAPYTTVLPKPLMPLGDRAILEVVVRKLAEEGFTNITISVGHLAHLIEAVFGDGTRHGVEIGYIREDVPLGTAGSLRLVEVEDTVLVLNGDIVTSLDFRDVVRHHKSRGNALTIAATQRQVKVDFGVIDVDGVATRAPMVIDYHEKPILDRAVSMGIYVLEPHVLDFIPDGEFFDFPDLVHVLLDAGAAIGAFVHDGLWLDIGRHEDYQRAVMLWEEGHLHTGDPPHREGVPLLSRGGRP